MLERGGVDGAEQPSCRRDAVEDCHRRGRRACPLPAPAELAATLVEVQAVEAAVHDHPLCAASLPDVPAVDLTAALAVGRDAAATLAATGDPTFQQRGPGYRGGAFGKFFLQGFFGHGAAFLPLGDVILAMARPTRAVTYTDESLSHIVHGVVGVANGRARGVLLTYCPSD